MFKNHIIDTEIYQQIDIIFPWKTYPDHEKRLDIFNLDIQFFTFSTGGGVALLYATRILKDIQTKNEDQKRGLEIIESALKVKSCGLSIFLCVRVCAPYC